MNETQFDSKTETRPMGISGRLSGGLLLIVVTRLGANRSVAPLVCSRRFCLILDRKSVV